MSSVSDRWIIGEGIETGTEYLVRTVSPRCIVQVEGEDALLLPLVVTNASGEGFGVVAWLDRAPDAATHQAILEEAIAACELFTDDSL